MTPMPVGRLLSAALLAVVFFIVTLLTFEASRKQRKQWRNVMLVRMCLCPIAIFVLLT